MSKATAPFDAKDYQGDLLLPELKRDIEGAHKLPQLIAKYGRVPYMRDIAYLYRRALQCLHTYRDKDLPQELLNYWVFLSTLEGYSEGTNCTGTLYNRIVGRLLLDPLVVRDMVAAYSKDKVSNRNLLNTLIERLMMDNAIFSYNKSIL